MNRPAARMPALDGLRGVAVAGVIAFHAGWLPGGFLGVDLFFVLSGFLITGILVDGVHRAGHVELGEFWARRARRLFPALAVFLGAVVVWAAVAGSTDQQDQVRRGLPAATLYLSNWWQLDHSGYWEAFRDPSPLNHLWSLAIEEQFYVLWPLVVALLARSRRMRLWIAVVCGAALAWSVVHLAVLADRPEAAYLRTDTRMGGLLAGALAALAYRRWTLPDDRRTSTVAGSALLGAAVIWVLADGADAALFRWQLPVHWLLVAVAIVALGASPHGRAARFLSVRLVRWVGERSYGLYLWHWLVQVALWPDLEGWPADVARTLVSVGLAELSYRWVEQPIRLQHTLSRPRRAILALGAMTALVGLGAGMAIPTTPPALAQFEPSSVTLPAGTSPPPGHLSAPPAAPSSSPATSTTDAAPIAPEVVWVGDSIGVDLAPAVLAAFQAAGSPARSLAAWGLTLADVRTDARLVALQTGSDPGRADVVVIHLPARDLGVGSEQQQASLAAVVDARRAAGQTVVLVPPPPVADPGFPVGNRAGLLAAATALDGPGVHLLDPATLWGVQPLRDPDGDGAPDRKPDGVHVCPQGAARFATWLVAQVATFEPGLRPADPSAWAAGEWQLDPTYDDPPGACAAV